MDVVQQAKWNLGATSCSFEQRQILDRIANQLPLVYGEPNGEPLPDNLRVLVAKLGADEPSTAATGDDPSRRMPLGLSNEQVRLIAHHQEHSTAE